MSATNSSLTIGYLPGCLGPQSQPVGPLPSLLAAPSTWYAAVATPNLNPFGNFRLGNIAVGWGANQLG